MKAKLTRDLEYPIHDRERGRIYVGTHKKGHVVDHIDAYLLVRLGVALPADNECILAAGMSDEMVAREERLYARTAMGISPEDWEAYDAGLIDGYHPDGSTIPGPNAHLAVA